MEEILPHSAAAPARRRTLPRSVAFIVSSPRSGSTWLETALNCHPQIYCTENRLFGRFAEMWPNNDKTHSIRITLDEYASVLSSYSACAALGLSPPAFAEKVLARFIESLLELSVELSGKPVFVDKITPYLGTSHLVLDSIQRHLPEASIIQLVRDGRDVATSGVFDWILRSSTNPDRDAYFVEKRPGAVLERFFAYEDLRTWTANWTQPIQAFRDRNPDAFMLRYEEMQKDQAASLTELFRRLGVDASPATVENCVRGSSFEAMSGGRKRGEAEPTAKARKGVSGDWRNYFTRRDGELFMNLAGKYLIDLGYEKDGSWVESLPETLGRRRKPSA